MKIIIDPGHGGPETGACSNGTNEKDLNLIYAQLLCNILTDYAEVKMTRTTDIYVGLNSRAAWINDQKPDLVISCHFNAFDSKARGCEVIHSIHSKPDIIKLCAELANGIISLGLPLRRIFSRESKTVSGKDYYAMIRNTAAPCIIVEPAFMDNVKDELIMSSPTFYERLASQLASAIVNHYKLQKVGGLDIREAINILQEHKVIQSPDYWLHNTVYNPDYVRQLIINMAQYLTGGE